MCSILYIFILFVCVYNERTLKGIKLKKKKNADETYLTYTCENHDYNIRLYAIQYVPYTKCFL